ncbi:isoamyl alcohol oxidase [Apiospora arundinis]
MRQPSIAAFALAFLVTVPSTVSVSVRTTWNGAEYDCKCSPEHGCWPSTAEWAALNTTVAGSLVADTPPGSVCYNTFDGPLGSVPTYDASQCNEALAQFANETWQIEQPAAALWTYFTNDTCRPTSNPSGSCTLGFYGIYVLMAKSQSHVKAGIDFAREKNLRLVIRNTGHDFIGRSTGWGSLVINTHYFQDLLGSVQQWALREVWSKGGGHGPLTTLHGLVADNALSFDVITAKSEYMTANADSNPDLFWALKGGGPSAFAVVLAATFKTIPETRATGVLLNINSTMTNDSDVFWEGVKIFHSHTNSFVNNGLYAYFEIFPLRFHVQPIVGLGKTASEMDALVKPMLDELKERGVPHDTSTKEFSTFYDLYIDLFEDEPAGNSALTGGWTFTHEDVARRNGDIVEAFKTVLSPREDLADQGYILGHVWNAGRYVVPRPDSSSSATHPKFRNATSKVIAALPVPPGSTWNRKQDYQHVLTDIQDAALRRAGPDGCAYVNEADPYQADWQEHFWGAAVYSRLRETRRKWDPEGVLYAVSTPGTEGWEVIEYGTKLCKRLSSV